MAQEGLTEATLKKKIRTIDDYFLRQISRGLPFLPSPDPYRYTSPDPNPHLLESRREENEEAEESDDDEDLVALEAEITSAYPMAEADDANLDEVALLRSIEVIF